MFTVHTILSWQFHKIFHIKLNSVDPQIHIKENHYDSDNNNNSSTTTTAAAAAAVATTTTITVNDIDYDSGCT
jgi:hypothetical protein